MNIIMLIGRTLAGVSFVILMIVGATRGEETLFAIGLLGCMYATDKIIDSED